MPISLTTGVELDAWASDLGVRPRRQNVDADQPGYDDALTGMRMEPDDTFRARILTAFRLAWVGR